MSNDPSLGFSGDKHAQLISSLAETIKDAAADKIIDSENISDTIASLMKDELTDETSASGIAIRGQKLQKRGDVKVEKNKEAPESRLVRKEDADQSANDFCNKEGNKQYHLDPLILSQLALEELGLGINEKSDPEDIVKIIRERMSGKGVEINPGMIDKGLDFLLEITRQQIATAIPAIKERLTLIYNRIETAKLVYGENNADEIKRCANFIGAVDAVITVTGEDIHTKVKQYGDFIHNPPALQELRRQLEKEGKNYKEILIEFKALSRFIGSRIIDTGTSVKLENAELAMLAKAARKMQALLGAFKAGKYENLHTLIGYLLNNRLLNEGGKEGRNAG